MSDVIVTDQAVSTVTCGGCGKAFRGVRGLTSHQNHRNAAMECKRAARLADADLISSRPEPVTETTVEPVVEEPMPAAIARGLQFLGNPVNPDAVTLKAAELVSDGPLPEPAGNRAKSWLERLIDARRIYTTIPTDVRTVLMKVDGIDKWAVRVHEADAAAITATADSSTLVKVTKHEAGGETVVTDFYWCFSGAPRVRVTEKFAV